MSSQIVYHGTATRRLAELPVSDEFAGAHGYRRLYVTDRPALAGRYANAQATRTVSAEFTDLAEHAVVLSIETTDDLTWTRRDAGHSTLDVSEATVRSGRIVAADIRECGYWNCTCHREATAFRAQHGL